MNLLSSLAKNIIVRLTIWRRLPAVTETDEVQSLSNKHGNMDEVPTPLSETPSAE